MLHVLGSMTFVLRRIIVLRAFSGSAQSIIHTNVTNAQTFEVGTTLLPFSIGSEIMYSNRFLKNIQLLLTYFSFSKNKTTECGLHEIIVSFRYDNDKHWSLV
jgi:hypothetical protein